MNLHLFKRSVVDGGEKLMRLLTIGVIAIGLASSACSSAETAAAAPGLADKATATAGSADAKASSAAALLRREVTIPSGTTLPITLDTSVGSNTSRVEQSVSAHLTRPIVLNGKTVLPAGTRVSGIVTDATRSGKVKGRAHVSVRFDSLTAENERYRIETAAIVRTAAATKKKDALESGAPAAGGAIIGAIAGGKKGAAIGTAVGGGAGTAVVLSTRGKEVHIPKGSSLTLRLTEPV